MPDPSQQGEAHRNTDRWDCGTFLLDLIGPYRAEDISTRWSTGQRETNEHVDKIIHLSWEKESKRAVRDSRNLFDGPLCRLIEFDGGRQRMELALGPVTFKEFLGTNLTHAHLRYVHGPGVLANPLGVSGAVVTRDGFLILGRRSERVIYHAGRIHPIGGLVVPCDQPGAAPDAPAQIVRELTEETNLPAACVQESLCLGLVRDKHIVQPELIFDLFIDAEAQAVRREAARAADASEHACLVPVRDHPVAVVNFIEQYFAEMTPLALASLLLHGLRHWGGGWFATTRGYLRSVV